MKLDMFYTPIHTKDQIDKIGNTIIYLCNEMGEVSKTKLLKLIYLIQEASIKVYGIPFFNLKFNVWKLGPVAIDLYAEFSSEPVLLSDYINLTFKEQMTFINSKIEFSDDEFNDLEMDLLKKITIACKKKNAKQLIDITHRKGSPWYISALNNGLLDLFDNDQANTSEVEIDLTILLNDQPEKLKLYYGHKEFLDRTHRLKG